MKFKVGQIVLMTVGESQGYGVYDVIRIVKDLHTDQFEEKEMSKLMSKLIVEGYAENINFWEWYLGSDGKFEFFHSAPSSS